MSGIAALVYVPSTTTPPQAVASMVAPSQPAIGTLSPVMVNASVADASVQPDARYQSARASSSAAQTASVAAGTFTLQGTTPLASGAISSFPSLFLAQLMAQDSGEAARQLVVSYETMLEFSQVKYKPSDASLPPPPAPMMDFFKSLVAERKAPEKPRPVITTQSTAEPERAAAPMVAQQAAPAPVKTRETVVKKPVSPAEPVAAAYRAAARNNASSDFEALTG